MKKTVLDQSEPNSELNRNIQQKMGSKSNSATKPHNASNRQHQPQQKEVYYKYSIQKRWHTTKFVILFFNRQGFNNIFLKL